MLNLVVVKLHLLHVDGANIPQYTLSVSHFSLDHFS
jgi:hypothetical protein